MSLRNLHPFVPAVIVAVVGFAGVSFAQEHPEHPKKMEHPKNAPAGVSKEDLAIAIEAYVHGEMEKGGGTWKVPDTEENTTLALSLSKVHNDKLAQTGPDVYFACADLKNEDGHMYDLDVFMKGPDKDQLKVTEVTVHKKDGKERYTWEEEHGMWEKVQVGKSAEHPHEHPKGTEHPK